MQALLQAQLEEQLRDRVLCKKDLGRQHIQSDLDKDNLSARVTELVLAVEPLQKQNLEKDQVNKALAKKPEALESLRRQESNSSLLALIHSVLHKRQLQVQDTCGCYETSQDLLGTLGKQLSNSECERRALEEQLHHLWDKTNGAMQAHEDTQHKVQWLQNAKELLSREKSTLVHSLQVAQQQSKELWQEWEKLQAAQEELWRWPGWRKSRSTRCSMLEQLEEKRSGLAKELVGVREALSCATLQRDMLQAEKVEVAEAGRVELELSMIKLRAEEASLQDSVSKLRALNESLTQGKLDLNRLVAQLEEEKAAALQGQQQQVEQEATVAQEEQEAAGGAAVGAGGASRLQEQLPQLSRQLSLREQELEQAWREAQQQAEALERVAWEKEVPAKELTGLAMQLEALEREGRTMSEKATVLHLEKEALEGSLFEMQRELAQLEACWEQLEANGQALLLAKGTLTVELAGLWQQIIATQEKVSLDKELIARKLVQAEQEAQAPLQEQQAAHAEDLQLLQREKEAAWRELEAEPAQLRRQQEELLAWLEAEKEEVGEKIAVLQQEHDEDLLLT
ncbi:hypothetical protein P7K49_039270 [Saguinus oedipus]|uniref:Uncharacterized protein n=1 Tax=Saguinus oedipus TaxID=9490 RepID=A0ABQ9TH17_SAGOE|nr:hypothetical protein P7K49_039270 [Saguinus oedipus]